MMNITYTIQGDYLLPDLIMEKQEEVTGKYAMMRENHLKTYKKATYSRLLTTGKLAAHLMDTQRTAVSRMERITKEMMKAKSVTEKLKEQDQMRWVQLMNNIRNRAEEMIILELITI